MGPSLPRLEVGRPELNLVGYFLSDMTRVLCVERAGSFRRCEHLAQMDAMDQI